MNDFPSLSNIGPLFSKAASPKQETVAEISSKPLLPVSLRVTPEEKSLLQDAAGKQSVSSYIRDRVFGDDTADLPRRRKRQRQAEPDVTLIAKLLGMLGQDDMTQALFVLLLAAKAGELEAMPDASDKLDTACNHIADMREMLILALNVKPKGKRYDP